MSDENIRDLLLKAAHFGILQIEWSGGEVFTRKGFMEMVAFAGKCGFEQNVLTNGVAIGKGVVDPKLLWKHFYAIQISVDSVGDGFNKFVGKNHWEDVSRGIELLLMKKPKSRSLSLTTTLDQSNISSLADIYEYVKDKDVTWKIARQVSNGRSVLTEDGSDELLLRSYQDLSALRTNHSSKAQILHPFDKDLGSDSIWPVEWETEPGARWFLYVSCNGDVYPFPYYDGIKEFYGGNVLNDTLFAIWNSTQFNWYRSVTREGTSCSGCKLVCQMWSRPFNYFRNRDLFGNPILHPNCPVKQT
jgi:MoaA/NifB/PqqE/SkfB family radical SAM enzyme